MEEKHFEALYPAETRNSEIGNILSFCKEGNSSQLIALPGVGKSNILRLLPYNSALRTYHLGENQKWFHFVLVNFSEVRNRSLLDITKFLFLQVVESLRERKMTEEYEEVSKIFKESLSFQDELVLFQGLKRAITYLATEKELTVVFLFDRFEEYLKNVTPEFFANLRSLRNEAKYRFSVVFALTRPLEESIEPVVMAEYYEFLAGHTIYLPLFDKTGFTFRKNYFEKTTGVTISEKTIDAILNLTAGHGKLTRVCLEGVGKNTPSQEFFLSQKPILGALYEIWYSLTPQEQKTIGEIAKNSASITEESYLVKTGLVKDNKIAILLFQEFVLRTFALIKNEKITFNQERNEIMKGEQQLSEILTSTEFKLLRFLLENPDRVCERDDVINAVWTDTKTSQGVSNEALDQIIYRLRKKIEEDPNNPTHLLTVKGRGFRFVQ